MRVRVLRVGLVLAGGASMWAQSPPADGGIYTAAQADRGQVVYDAQCASCHGAMRAIVPDVAALLADHTFRNRWRGRSLGELFGVILETMPQDAPGSLSPEQSADLVASILRGNRVPAGDVDLAHDVDVLNQIPFDP